MFSGQRNSGYLILLMLQLMEASFESVYDIPPSKAGRKFAYGLVKNKKPFFTRP
jgi:hypothetical protein